MNKRFVIKISKLNNLNHKIIPIYQNPNINRGPIYTMTYMKSQLVIVCDRWFNVIETIDPYNFSYTYICFDYLHSTKHKGILVQTRDLKHIMKNLDLINNPQTIHFK